MPCASCYLGIIGFVAEAGADIMQLRAKDLSEDEVLSMSIGILPGLMKHGVPLIINDHRHAAQKLLRYGLSTGGESGCVGLHIGQSDGNQLKARLLMVDQCILDVTIHTIEQAIEAQDNGADYVGFGAIFPTATKTDVNIRTLDLAREIEARIDIPVYLIGGINSLNLPGLVEQGFTRICIASAISKAPHPGQETKSILEILGAK